MKCKLFISAILLAAVSGVSAHAHTLTAVGLPSPSDLPGERIELSLESIGGITETPIRLVQSSVSARKAKAIALREVPGGEVVDISRDGNVYRVRIVARSGRVVDVLVDATSGRVVG